MKQRANHLDIEGLLVLLRRCENLEAPVWYDFTHMVATGNAESYRGYYTDVALGYAHINQVEKPATVAHLIEKLQGMLGGYVTGYKGGDYQVRTTTALWVANRGEAGGTAVVGLVDNGYQVTIQTEKID